MPTQYPDLFAALAAPFEPNEVKVRSTAGRQLHYITARTTMNRLDDVLGPEGWWDEYVPGENSVLCRLTIRLPDGSTLTKADAGGYAGMADSGDDDKSGYSDAFKRAAVKFGVSRYLYRDGVPTFVQERGGFAGDAAEPEAHEPRHGGGDREHARQEQSRPSGRAQGGGAGGGGGNGNQNQGPPRNGRGLFAWVKDMEEKHEVGLLTYLNKWSKLQDFPGRMIDWDAEQVRLAFEEASRKLREISIDPRTDALSNG
jgi:hypothetical protein